METLRVKVSSRGYIVLPASLRKELDIIPGTSMLVRRENDKIILQPVSSYTEKLAGLTENAIGDTPEAVDDFISAERQDRKG